MTLSLLLVYLHDMRGFTNTFGGLLLAYGSLVSIIASTPMGALARSLYVNHARQGNGRRDFSSIFEQFAQLKK